LKKYPQISYTFYTHSDYLLHIHSSPLAQTTATANTTCNVFPNYPIRLHPQLGRPPNAPHPPRPSRRRGPNHTLPRARQIHVLRPRLVAITQRLQRRGDRVMSPPSNRDAAFPLNIDMLRATIDWNGRITLCFASSGTSIHALVTETRHIRNTDT
jgi:hypothetical protein